MAQDYKIMKLKKWIDTKHNEFLMSSVNKNGLFYSTNNPQLYDNESILESYNIYYKDIDNKWQYKDEWDNLSSRKDIYLMDLLKKNTDKINWYNLSANPTAIDIITENLDKVDWIMLSTNPNAISILRQNMDKFFCPHFIYNENIIYLLTDDIKTITWTEIHNKLDDLHDKYKLDKRRFINNFSHSNNKYILNLLDKKPDEINWCILCEANQDNAEFLIKKYIDKIPFGCLCYSKFAIEYIEENIGKYDNPNYWENLSVNPDALNILEKNQDKINYFTFYALNEGIFEYDYDFIYQRTNVYKKELLEKVLNPTRLMNICNAFNVNFNDLIVNFYSL